MIKVWEHGKWYCEQCDKYASEYGRHMVRWTASWPPPAVCWKCFKAKWHKPASTKAAAQAIADAMVASRFKAESAEDVRQALRRVDVSVHRVSDGRLAAMVYREMRALCPN
jgi:hypothetical protein